jgi:hypothetical protein
VLDQNKTALGVFLYIEMMITNISYDSMCAVLVKRGVDRTIVWWIRATLEGQLAAVILNGFSMTVAVSGVCPQECVLSPIL